MNHSTGITFMIIAFIIFLPVTPWARIIAVEPVITGLARPVAMTHAGDSSGRLFITLQAGRIIIYGGTQVLPTPFLDIRSLVSCCGERGLLSVAFHPNYVNNGFFYINYTNTDGDTVIARYTVSDNPNVADPDSAVILLTIPQPFSNHNGGQLQFGPDGYLYIGMGDGGSANDPQNNAQDLRTLLGKMLRIDVDSGSPFAIPSDNPFVGNAKARDEIWAFGLRNPWRFSFDRKTNDLFIADVGQNSWEEVDFQPADSTGAENYGWRLMEGNHCANPSTDCNDGTLTLPILEYDYSLGCSITGGYRYRGTQIPQLYGTYLYGDFCSGRIWGAQKDDIGWTTTELLNTDYSISTFGEDESGEIYFAHHSSVNGAIYHIVSAFTISPPSGKYIYTQSFDLALILKVSGVSALGGKATFDGSDVTAALGACILAGTLISGGQTFRCPGITGGTLSPGAHTLSVSLDLSDGTSVSDTVSWEVLQNKEP